MLFRSAASWDVAVDVEQARLDVGTALEHVHGGVRLRGHSDGRDWHCDGDLRIDSALWRGVQVTGVEGPLAIDARGVRFGTTASRPGEGEPRHVRARLGGGELLLDGAAGEGAKGRALHKSFTSGNLSMASYVFG